MSLSRYSPVGLKITAMRYSRVHRVYRSYMWPYCSTHTNEHNCQPVHPNSNFKLSKTHEIRVQSKWQSCRTIQDTSKYDIQYDMSTQCYIMTVLSICFPIYSVSVEVGPQPLWLLVHTVVVRPSAHNNNLSHMLIIVLSLRLKWKIT